MVHLERFASRGVLLGAALLIGCGDDTTSGAEPVTVRFEGEAEIFPGLDYSTGLQPAGSPVQASFTVTASGTSAVTAEAAVSGSKDDPVLTGMPDGGELKLTGGFAMIGQLVIDIDGVPSYDGPIPGIENVDIPVEGTETYSPFSVGEARTVRADIPPSDLPGIPLPGGIPGQLVLTIAEGSFVEQDFTGACAGADGEDAVYTGTIDRRGTLVIRPRVDVEVPVVGTQSFDIPEFSVDLALGTSDLAMEAKLERFGAAPADGDEVKGSCGGSGEGGGGATTTGAGQTGTGSTGQGGAATTSTGTSSTTSTGTGGLECGDANEPNDSIATAIEIGTTIQCGDAGVSRSGVLTGYDDIDVFSFPEGRDRCAGACGDASVCATGPKVVETYPQNGDVVFCLFFDCGYEPYAWSCEGSATPVTDGNLNGCCDTFDVSMQVECTQGAGGLLQQYVTTYSNGPDECLDYGFRLVNEE